MWPALSVRPCPSVEPFSGLNCRCCTFATKPAGTRASLKRLQRLPRRNFPVLFGCGLKREVFYRPAAPLKYACGRLGWSGTDLGWLL